jgi:hypothetical protein
MALLSLAANKLTVANPSAVLCPASTSFPVTVQGLLFWAKVCKPEMSNRKERAVQYNFPLHTTIWEDKNFIKPV